MITKWQKIFDYGPESHNGVVRSIPSQFVPEADHYSVNT